MNEIHLKYSKSWDTDFPNPLLENTPKTKIHKWKRKTGVTFRIKNLKLIQVVLKGKKFRLDFRENCDDSGAQWHLSSRQIWFYWKRVVTSPKLGFCFSFRKIAHWTGTWQNFLLKPVPKLAMKFYWNLPTKKNVIWITLAACRWILAIVVFGVKRRLYVWAVSFTQRAQV